MAKYLGAHMPIAAGGRRALRQRLPDRADVLQSDQPAGPAADRRGRGCSSAARRCCSARPCSISWRSAICSSTRRWRSCSRRRSWWRSWPGPMLGEWVGWRRWTAIMVGFAGVLVVVRPGMGGMQWAALLSLGSAFCYAGLQHHHAHAVAHRFQRDHAVLRQPVRLRRSWSPVLPFVWTPPPSWIDIVLMVAMGVFGAGGHFLLILAHRRAPASVLSPFIYTADRLGDHARLSGVRQRAQPLDPRRRGDRDRLRPLSAQPRAQGDRQSCPDRARLTK